MSNNPSCDLVEHPTSVPEMQSSNEHTDKINSEHASPAPPLNAQTHSLHRLFPPTAYQPTNTHITSLHSWPEVSRHTLVIVLHSTTSLFSLIVFSSLSLILLELIRNHKSKDIKIPKKAQVNKSFLITVIHFSRLLICWCAQALSGPLTARLAFV